jgi:hypothetical protein
MARKSKKIEDDAWLWMSQPVVPGMLSLEPADTPPRPRGLRDWKGSLITHHPGSFTVTTTYPGKPIKEMPIEGFTRAMFEYAAVAALDPTNVPEGAVWAGVFGISYRWGLLFAVGKGILVGAPLLAIVDPQDRWEGGLDETRAYKAGVAGIPGAHPNLNKEILMGAGSWGSVV